MSATIRIQPHQLKNALIGEHERLKKNMQIAAYRAAMRFKTLIVDTIDEMGITDRGVFKNSWKVLRTIEGAQVFSDCPYAGVIELGARPHPVSEEGQELIAQWAMRKLDLDETEARRAAFLIARKIARVGQEPTYMVRDHLPEARRYFAEELVRLMNSRQTPSEAHS